MSANSSKVIELSVSYTLKVYMDDSIPHILNNVKLKKDLKNEHREMEENDVTLNLPFGK
jgi:hypothetical protein